MHDGVKGTEDATEDITRNLERRLVLRVLHRWREVAGDRPFPATEEANAATFPEFWPFCYVLDVSAGIEQAVFTEFGEELEDACGRNMARRAARDTPSPSAVSESLRHAAEVLRKQVPVTRSGSFETARGTNVLYRTVLLPLGDHEVTHILGAANFREIARRDSEGPKE